MIKLGDILKEIGDATSASPELIKKSKWSDSYQFKTDKNEYEIQIDKSVKPHTNKMTYEVSFGVLNPSGQASFTTKVGDFKNMFKVMTAVVKAITKEAVEDQKQGYEVKEISFSSVKESEGDTRRKNFYRAYVEKLMPAGSTVKEIGDSIEIILPQGHEFTLHDN